MRFVAGEQSLVEEWITSFYEQFRLIPELSDAVLRNTVKHKATLNVLGRVVTERFGEHAGGFDVKYGLVHSTGEQCPLFGFATWDQGVIYIKKNGETDFT